MWFILALGSAVFAALTSILAKVGIDGVNSNLATAIRTAVVLVMAWGMVFLTDAQGGLSGISRRIWKPCWMPPTIWNRPWPEAFMMPLWTTPPGGFICNGQLRAGAGQ